MGALFAFFPNRVPIVPHRATRERANASRTRRESRTAIVASSRARRRRRATTTARGDARNSKSLNAESAPPWRRAIGERSTRARDMAREHWSADAWTIDPGMFDVRALTPTPQTDGGGKETQEERTSGPSKASTTTQAGTSSQGKATEDALRSCEVDGCEERRSSHRGAGLCDKHRHAESFVLRGANRGKPMRWCFYCHRAHDLGKFTSASRSICHEKFTLRQGRRAEKKHQEARKAASASAVLGAFGAPGPGTNSGGDSGETSAMDTSLSKDPSHVPIVDAIVMKHRSQVVPQGYDAKFWVAHPRELQERMDMWDLVRRLNSTEEPVGMYGTIVPGCVRFTVRGWRGTEETLAMQPLDRRAVFALGDERSVSVSEMAALDMKPRRVVINKRGGVTRRAVSSRGGANVDAIFASAREKLYVRTPRDPRVNKIPVRFFSEYVDREVPCVDTEEFVSIDPLSDAGTRGAVIDHVLSIQCGGHGAPYEHVAVIEDEDIARELVALDASTTGVEARKALRGFALDYVWLSSSIETAMFYEEDVKCAMYIVDSARKIFGAWGRAPNALARVEMLRTEIFDFDASNESRCRPRVTSFLKTKKIRARPPILYGAKTLLLREHPSNSYSWL